MNKKTTETTRLSFEKDGKYHWIYEINLFKNLTFFFLVYKILFIIFLCIFGFVTFIDFKNFGLDHAVKNFTFLFYFFIGFTAVTILGYLLYAAVMSGKYVVEFEMDEKGINHKQVDWQAKRAKKLGSITAAAGMASGRISTVGVGVNATRTEMYSDFSSVKKVKSYPRKNLIKVTETLSHNRVYVTKEDFEFVNNYIVSHCVNAK